MPHLSEEISILDLRKKNQMPKLLNGTSIHEIVKGKEMYANFVSVL